MVALQSTQSALKLSNLPNNFPSGWRWLKLGDFANTKSGGTPRREVPNFYEGIIPWIKSGELKDTTITRSEEHINQEAIDHSSAQIFPKGTLVVALYGATAGRVGLLEIASATNQAVCAVFPDNSAIPEYLFYALIYRRNDLLKERYGGAQPNISQTVLRSFYLPIPPLPEQRAIAHVLTTIRQAIEASERVIEATRQLKKSTMKHLFTYGPVPVDEVDRVPLKETEIGLVPEGWSISRLGDLIEKPEYGYTASSSLKEVGPKFIRITDISDEGRVNWNLVPYCACSEKELPKYIVKKGDILIARIGATTGKSFRVEDCPQAIFASYLIRLRPNIELLEDRYLYQFTTTDIYWKQINSSKGGRLKGGVNIPNLQNLLIPCPNKEEQNNIQEILGSIDVKIIVETNRKNALESLFQSLLHHLMTGKVRVG